MLKVKLKDIIGHQYPWDPHSEHVKKSSFFVFSMLLFVLSCFFFFPVCLLVCFVVVICPVFVFWSWFVFVVVWLFKWIERLLFATIRDSRSVWLTQLEPFYIGLAHSTIMLIDCTMWEAAETIWNCSFCDAGRLTQFEIACDVGLKSHWERRTSTLRRPLHVRFLQQV